LVPAVVPTLLIGRLGALDYVKASPCHVDNVKDDVTLVSYYLKTPQDCFLRIDCKLNTPVNKLFIKIIDRIKETWHCS